MIAQKLHVQCVIVSIALLQAQASQDFGSETVETFIRRWDGTGMAERANYSAFLHELCDLLDVPRPDGAIGGGGDYRLERAVKRHDDDGSISSKRIDLYKRGCFVLEAKQGAAPDRKPAQFELTVDAQRRSNLTIDNQRRSNIRNTPEWARYMQQAKGQAERYARDIPPEEGWPPFLIVCDIGFCFDLYADFSGTGKHYAQFPDRERFRLYLPDLRRAEVRARLQAIWTDPKALDPALKRAEVTSDIAALLARLAEALEGPPDRPRHAPEHVATFLMRCIFCMFAQSVNLLPQASFTKLLERCRANPVAFLPLVSNLWATMDTGGFSIALEETVPRFNGGLFRHGAHGGVEPLAVDRTELRWLLEAASKDWAEVEPAIFGTLLENALDAKERGRLGAQFTPRAFVERLVLPTVMEPLREEWDGVRGASEGAMRAGDTLAAAAFVRAFHARLCNVQVLDPACGSGNFLYVTLELMKRLEGEVLDTLDGLAPNQAGRMDMAGVTVDPHQFHGLDVNPRAVPVAELVLWIGYLQWHFRTNGKTPPAEPILHDFQTIREADALLAHDGVEIERDKVGRPVTSWGGRTKLHPTTGKAVPDETDQIEAARFLGGRQAPWPEVDFIVGNPPFVAGKDLRAELGSGYAAALWAAYPKVPRSADLAMFFWWRAAQAVRTGKTQRFGFITSNSIRQVFCRRVVAAAMEGARSLRLAFAIPDHPWSQGWGSAAVRIAMTVGTQEDAPGRLLVVGRETAAAVPKVVLVETFGMINADLTVGVSLDSAQALRANERVCSRGMALHGAGFIVSPETATTLGLGKMAGLAVHIRPYLNGRDMAGCRRGVMAIDLDGLSEAELRQRYPAVFQHISLYVKPERDHNNEPSRRHNWWLFGRNNSLLRTALAGLPRYIATSETAKHRFFVFQPGDVIPDNMLVCIASENACDLGVLSSRIHALWAPAAGGRLGFGNDPRYNKTRCFDPFPFPSTTLAQSAVIAELAEELDALRKTRIAAHPLLTMTILYNVLAEIRAGKPLSGPDKKVLDDGQVEVLRHLHDRLDQAVADAYGWPVDLSAAAIVERVVALNRERAAEEAVGHVRWLRPAFQAPTEPAVQKQQLAMAVDPGAVLPAWPKHVPAQYVALRAALSGKGITSPHELAQHFRGVRPAKLAGMLETLAALGQARDAGSGRFAT